jgi:hypothetical protein
MPILYLFLNNDRHIARQVKGMTMILLLNIVRYLMVLWIAYGLLLIFAPSVVHSPPNPTGGAIQAIAAFAIGSMLDRIKSVLLRRKAADVDKQIP